MGLKKGQTNNTAGRPKGTPNKTTKEMRRWIFNIVNNNIETLENDLKGLEPKERWQIINGLLPYIVTKLESGRYYGLDFIDE